VTAKTMTNLWRKKRVKRKNHWIQNETTHCWKIRTMTTIRNESEKTHSEKSQTSWKRTIVSQSQSQSPTLKSLNASLS